MVEDNLLNVLLSQQRLKQVVTFSKFVCCYICLLTAFYNENIGTGF